MQVTHYECPKCNSCFEAKPHLGTKLTAAGAGVVIGGLLTRSVLWSLAIGGVTYWAAGKVDGMLAARCPNCHAVANVIPEPSTTPIGAETEAAKAA